MEKQLENLTDRCWYNRVLGSQVLSVSVLFFVLNTILNAITLVITSCSVG
jgi:hypothetical protein